jgi:hypothetical protein
MCVVTHHWYVVTLLSQVAPNYPIVRTNLAVALTDLGTALKLKGQLHQGIGKHIQQQWTGFAAGFAAGVAAGVAAVALTDLALHSS